MPCIYEHVVRHTELVLCGRNDPNLEPCRAPRRYRKQMTMSSTMRSLRSIISNHPHYDQMRACVNRTKLLACVADVRTDSSSPRHGLTFASSKRNCRFDKLSSTQPRLNIRPRWPAPPVSPCKFTVHIFPILYNIVLSVVCT